MNRLSTNDLNNITHFEALFKKTPDCNALRVFGSVCYPCLRAYTTDKLEPRSKQCVFCDIQGSKGDTYVLINHQEESIEYTCYFS